MDVVAARRKQVLMDDKHCFDTAVPATSSTEKKIYRRLHRAIAELNPAAANMNTLGNSYPRLPNSA